MEALKKSTTKDEFIKAYGTLVQELGITVLNSRWLRQNSLSSSYNKGLKHGLTLQIIAESLKKEDEFQKFQTTVKKNIPHFVIWTPDEVENTAKSLIKEHGKIPPVEWLDKNNLAGFSKAVRQRFGGIDALRQKYQKEGVQNVSRSGLIHQSMAETSFANFLWSRGINIYPGGRYPPEYEAFSGRALGKYDLQFDATYGKFVGHRIMCEIFGDSESSGQGPNGKRNDEYLKTKQFKIDFHKNNQFFFHCNYICCYSEDKLEDLLEPYIGRLKPIRFENDYDDCFAPVNWSIADRAIEQCKYMADQIEGGKLPSTEWFSKTGPYKDRKVYEWEPPEYGNIVENIQKLGGITTMRTLLGQAENNNTKWTKELIISELANFYRIHNHWPISILNQIKSINSKSRTADQKKKMSEAKRINTAIERYYGHYQTAYDLAIAKLPEDMRPVGVLFENPTKKWHPEAIIQALTDFFTEHLEWPGATENRLRQMRAFILPDQEHTLQVAGRLTSAIKKNFSSFAEAYNKAREQLAESLRPDKVIDKNDRGCPKGVCLTRNGKFRASIGINGKSKDLGTYDTAEQASEAYQKAFCKKQNSR